MRKRYHKMKETGSNRTRTHSVYTVTEVRLRWVILALLSTVLLPGFQAEDRSKRIESGRLLLQHRNWKAAANEFERVLKTAPKDAEAHTGLGIALWELGQREAALRALKTAIQLKSGYEEAELALGFMLQQQGDPDGAIGIYREVLKRNPKSAEGHNWLGVAHMQKSQMAEAIAAFRKAIELQPDLVRAYNNLGSTLAQSGDLQEGIEAFEAGLKHAPDDVALHLNLGSALRGKGDAEGAIRHFEIVLTHESENPEVHYQLGHARREKGDLQDAISAFERALALSPEHQQAYYGLAQTLRQLAASGAGRQEKASIEAEEQLQQAAEARGRGDLQGAIRSLSKAVEVAPKFAPAHYHLGAALWYAGDRERAAAELDAALQLDPALAEAYSLRVLSYREAGDLDAAMRSGQKAIALDPKQPVGYFDLGVLLLRKNRLPAAIGQFEAGLNVPGLSSAPPDLELAIRELREALGRQEGATNPGAQPRIILARMLGLAGAEPSEVITEFKAALKIEPENAQAHNGLGLVYTQLNQDEPAIAAFREAVRIHPAYADAHANLGAILTATKVEEAVAELEKAIQLQPTLLKAHFNLAIAYGASPGHGAQREIEQLRKLLALEAGYPRADFALGKALLRTGSVAEAATHLERATQLEPQFGEGHYQLGLALARAGRTEQSSASLKKGRELIAANQREQNLLLDIREGKAALEEGEFEEAVEKFRRVLRARPELVEVQYQLGMALKGKEERRAKTPPVDETSQLASLEQLVVESRFAEARPLLEAYVREHPQSSRGWYGLGYSLFAQQQIGESVNALAKSLSLDVTNANAHKVLGRVLMMIGRFDAAQREFEVGEKYDPKSAELPFNLGRLFSIQDQWVPARDAFQRALRIDPDYMEAYDGLGFAMEALGDDDAAIANYRKAAAINQSRTGNFASPYINLSALHNKAGNSDAALESAKEAVAVNENADRAWYQMGRAHERRGELEAAAEALRRAIALNGKVSSYHYVLAGVYRRLGKPQESRDAMEAFTRLDRESRKLEQERLETLRQGRHD